MEQRNKNLFIGGLLAIVLVMAVGYAAFATQLNINGTATIESRWEVKITDISVSGDPTGTATSKSSAVTEGNLAATFESELVAPGDSVTYNVTVENTGTLPAKLNAITFNQTNNGTGTAEAGDAVENQGTSYEGDNAIVYSYTGISVNSTLAAANDSDTDKVTFQVTVTYNDKIKTQPDAKQLKSNLKMVLSYVQADA